MGLFQVVREKARTFHKSTIYFGTLKQPIFMLLILIEVKGGFTLRMSESESIWKKERERERETPAMHYGVVSNSK